MSAIAVVVALDLDVVVMRSKWLFLSRLRETRRGALSASGER